MDSAARFLMWFQAKLKETGKFFKNRDGEWECVGDSAQLMFDKVMMPVVGERNSGTRKFTGTRKGLWWADCDLELACEAFPDKYVWTSPDWKDWYTRKRNAPKATSVILCAYQAFSPMKEGFDDRGMPMLFPKFWDDALEKETGGYVAQGYDELRARQAGRLDVGTAEAPREPEAQVDDAALQTGAGGVESGHADKPDGQGGGDGGVAAQDQADNTDGGIRLPDGVLVVDDIGPVNE